MAESGDHLDLGNDPPAKKFPWGIILVAVMFIALGVLTFWATRDKKNQKARDAIMTVLDKELSTDELAVKTQREKLNDLTKQVEELRTRIQIGDVKDGKAAIGEFNKLAAEQRSEREKFLKMADEYNQKVAKYHQLEQ
jgi:FtsZ-interacting cell division protein ZipA